MCTTQHVNGMADTQNNFHQVSYIIKNLKHKQCPLNSDIQIVKIQHLFSLDFSSVVSNSKSIKI